MSGARGSPATIPGSLVPDSDPVSAHLIGDSKDARFEFEAPVTGIFHVVVTSNLGRLAIWATDKDNQLVGVASKRNDFLATSDYDDPVSRINRAARYTLELKVRQKQTYNISVQYIGDSSSPVDLKLWLFGDSFAHLPLSTDLKLPNVQMDKKVLIGPAGAQTTLRGYPAHFFRVRLSDKEKQWVRVSVTAPWIAPSIYLFDLEDHSIIAQSSFREGSAQQNIVSKEVKGDEVGIAIQDRLDAPNSSNTPFEMTVGNYSGDPEAPPLTRIRSLVSDPLVGLLSGIAIGGALSYLFYRRSIARKNLSYQVESDKVVMRSEDAQSSDLQVLWGGRQITSNVCLCALTMRLRSHRDVSRDDIKEPIRIAFQSATSLLRVSAEASPGWEGISIPPEQPKAVELHVNHLRPKDWIRLDVFYTQNSVQPISVLPQGRILDGTISKDRGTLPPYLLSVLLVAIFAMFGLVTIKFWTLQHEMVLTTEARFEFVRLASVPLLIIAIWFLFTTSDSSEIRTVLRRLLRRWRVTPDDVRQFQTEPSEAGSGESKTNVPDSPRNA